MKRITLLILLSTVFLTGLALYIVKNSSEDQTLATPFIKDVQNLAVDSVSQRLAYADTVPGVFLTDEEFNDDSIVQLLQPELERQTEIADERSKPSVQQLNALTRLEKDINMSFRESYAMKQSTDGRSARANLSHIIRGGGSSYRLMEFSRGIAALITMFEVTDDPTYIGEALELTEQLISKSQPGNTIKNNPDYCRDEYLGWSNHNPSERENAGNHLEEVPLYESYLFRYLAKMAYLVDVSQTIPQNSPIRTKSDKIYQFIEKNGWEKWFVRGERRWPGCLNFLFRSRTHMTSHWAIVALYSKKLTNDVEKRRQYEQFLSLYDQSLRDNFRIDNKHNAYSWNMTWDESWPHGTKCNPASKNAIIQDVSHGNHVVTYIIESYEISENSWKRDDIDKLANTLKYLVYDSKNVRFNGDLNGKFIANVANGLRLSDGFVKLARYDKSVFDILQNVRKKQYQDSHFNFYEAQYVSEMLLAAKHHH